MSYLLFLQRDLELFAMARMTSRSLKALRFASCSSFKLQG